MSEGYAAVVAENRYSGEIVASGMEEMHGLSPLQAGMVFHSLTAGHSGVYHQQLLIHWKGRLNLDAIELAWEFLMERHDILRSGFRLTEDSELRQVFQKHVESPTQRVDWTKVFASERETRFNQFLALDRAQEFVLETAPLFRWTSVLLGADEYAFLWTSHHAIFDGRSRQLLLRELFELHDRICSGEKPAAAQALSYTRYLNWLETLAPEAAEHYWTKFLEGFTAPTPTPLQSGAETASAGAELNLEQSVKLDAVRTERLQTFAASHGLTLNTLVQGAWALLLGRYSGESDVVFGATRACRKSALAGEAESMVGLFMNTLPVRVKMPDETSVVDWLQELRKQAMDIRPYEHTALSLVQEWSPLPFGVSLFNTLVVFEGYDLKESLARNDERWRQASIELFEQTNYPLTLSAKSGAELILSLEYDPDLYDARAIVRMLGHLETLLEGMATNAGGRLKDLCLLTPLEYEQLIHAWNQTDIDWSAEGDVVAQVEHFARQQPGAVAVEAGTQVYSYAELNARANRLAHYLQRHGAGRDIPIGVCLERSLDLAISLLAILKAGSAYVPLDPANPIDRLQMMIEDADLGVILTTRELRSRLPPRLGKTDGFIAELDQLAGSLATLSDENLPSAFTNEALAYQMYTSGSTGRPKGVMITRGAMKNHNLAAREAFNLTPQDRVLQFSTISFDIAVEEIFPTWLAGATLVFRDDEMAYSIGDFSRGAEAKRITALNLPTAFWKEWAYAAVHHQMSEPASVRLVVVGGEKADAEAYAAWRKMLRRDVRWINTYGPTECTVTATSYEPKREVGAIETEIPIGRPLPNTRVYVLDASGQPVPIGVDGELYIGGAGVARGYWRRPELTDDCFIRDPFLNQPGARMYRTGDVVRYREDGNLEFRGRKDAQIKIGSYRVEPGEIESAIRQFAGIEDSIVVAHSSSSPEAGADKQLIAYVKPLPDAAPLSGDRLRQELRRSLPAYMIPAMVLVVEHFPRTPNGKIDVLALPPPLAPVSTPIVEQRSLTSVELRLQQIWQDVLGRPAIDVEDNFFHLGGTSLLSLRLAARYEKEFGGRLPLPVFFRDPTIRALAQALETKDSKPQSCLVLLQSEGSNPPFFCVHGAGGAANWFSDLATHVGTDQPFYGVESPALASLETAVAMAETLTVPTLAATYVDAIRSLHPKGPYRIGGYSMGGIVAFEMAQQLAAAGEQVSLLAILDASCPASALPKWKKLPVFIWRFLMMDLPDKKRFLSEKWSWLKQLRSEQQAEKSHEVANHLDIVKSANERAAYEYQPALYPGPITLIRSSRPHLTSPLSQDLGWAAYAGQGVEILLIPGDHYSLFKPRNLDLLSNHLRTALARSSST